MAFDEKRRSANRTHLVRVQIDALKTDPGFVSDWDKDGIWVLEPRTALVLEHREDGELRKAESAEVHTNLWQFSEPF